MTITTIPSPKDYLEKTPLYGVTHFHQGNFKEVIGILFYTGVYDAYCTDCAKESTFKASAVMEQASMQEAILRLGALATKNLDPLIPLGAYLIKGECVRNKEHTQAHTVIVKRKIIGRSSPPAYSYSIVKGGQYPSAADLELPKLKRYEKVLSSLQREEFARAIGLAAHGVGVGSFVYLRRIFESLIEQAHSEAKQEKSWKEAKYQAARMQERVKMLRKYLPAFLVENSSLYSLISKGIHELGERECLEHFGVLKACTEIILESKLAERELEERMASARSGLSTAINKVTEKQE